MKSLSVALAAHYQQDTTTLATCAKATLRNGTVLGYTGHISELTISALLYVPGLIDNPSAVQSTAGTDVDNLELLGVFEPGVISPADIDAGLWDFAALEFFRVNYLDLTMGTDPLRKGTLGEVRHGKTQFSADLMGMAQRLTQRVGRIIMPTCDVELGDAKCKKDLGAFTNGIVATTVTSVTSRRVFAASALTMADGWFENGTITFTGGANTGLAREVKTSLATGALEMQESFPYPVVSGDAISAKVGCLKRFTQDCRDKFSNTINFHGYHLVPGQDQLSKTAGRIGSTPFGTV